MRLRLSDGTPISNLRVTNVQTTYESFQYQSLGDSQTSHGHAGVRVELTAEYDPQAVDPIQVNQKVDEIKSRFEKRAG